MNGKVTFSSKRVMLILSALGLLLGVILAAGVLLNVGPASAQRAAITAADARAIAEAAHPGATAMEVERDDSGRNAYEVELDNGLEVIVDATTGQIIGKGNDDSDDTEDDDAAEAAEDNEAATASPEQISAGFCSATASVQFDACRNEVKDDFFTAQALCIQVLDEQERRQCFLEAEATRQEDNQLCVEQRDARQDLCDALGEERYDPNFDPALFDDDFSNLTNPNPYFPLTIGNHWDYVEGDETVAVEVLNETKLIEGVTCIVVNDLVQVDGVAVEDTDDWYGQRKDGTVDYCGEIVQNFETFAGDNPPEPELVDIEGSFKAGREALAGTLFLASPTVGATYRQEFSPGNAEDAATVLSISYSYGSDPELDEFVPQALAELLCGAGDCVVTGEFIPIEPGVFQRKYYALGIGLFLEVNPDTGDTAQLVNCNFDSRCAGLPTP